MPAETSEVGETLNRLLLRCLVDEASQASYFKASWQLGRVQWRNAGLWPR